MDYKVEKQKGAVKIDFSVAASEWKEEMTNAYFRTRGKYNIPGFRKGHAPRGVIESMYGKGVFFEDAFESVFKRCYGEVLDKESWIFPVDDPKIDLGEETADKFTFNAVVTVKPEIKLGAYKELEVPKAKVSVSESEVDYEIEHAREHASRMVEIDDRAVKDGDTVTIDYSGSVNGVKFAGGTAEKQELVIGSHSFIPGFEEQVIGMNKGETKDINVKFPEDYHAEDLKGKDAVFTVTLHEIRLKQLPELNDEFARDVSENCNTMAEYRAHIEKTILEHKEKHSETESENEMLKMIADSCEVEIPQCMIDSEIDYMLADFEMQLQRAYGGMKLSDYFKYTGLKEIDFRRQRRESAIANVKTRLALEKIIEAEKIEVTDKEVDAELEKSSSAEASEEISARRRAYIKSDLLMAKVMDFLKKNNKFVEKKESSEKKTSEKKTSTKKTADKSAEEKPAAKKAPAKKTTKKAE